MMDLIQITNDTDFARRCDALEGMRSFNLGGLTVSYSPRSHTGLDFADLSIIDASGKFRR